MRPRPPSASRCDHVHASLHREICRLAGEVGLTGPRRLLDVGCWDGRRTLEYAKSANISLEETCGLEVSPAAAEIAQRSFRCEQIDIETSPFPYRDQQFDLVVCNQVMEHCKNIFRPLGEIHRVLRAGGRLIYSVPNLASLHNRAMLLVGLQPSSIRVLGPHVRGFTHRSTVALLELNQLFEVERVVGVGFYPLPAQIGDRLARRFPRLSHTTIVVARRKEARGETWEAVMRAQEEQTGFFPVESREVV